MAARRLLIIMVILLAISTILAVSVPERQQRADEETTTDAPPTTTAEAPPADKTETDAVQPAGATPFQANCDVIECITVDADAKQAEPVRVTVGRQVAIQVTSAEADVVEVRELGLVDAVGPDQPATFDLFVAPGLLDTQGGRYAIRLVEADRLIGRIEVSAAPEEKGDGKAATPPARGESAKASGAQRP